jgi:hypothetical protein
LKPRETIASCIEVINPSRVRKSESSGSGSILGDEGLSYLLLARKRKQEMCERQMGFFENDHAYDH